MRDVSTLKAKARRDSAMKILVACETSGRVRDAFIKKGHEAVSLDILPTDSKSQGKHITDRVEEYLTKEWDMIIAFPPCTWLCIASAWRWNLETSQENMTEAFSLVKKIWAAPCEKICIENPVGWLNNNWQQPQQILSPHYFGSRFQKRTCLWLKGLPPLIYGCQTLNPRPLVGQFGSKHNKSKLHSKICIELAEAMAQQWS